MRRTNTHTHTHIQALLHHAENIGFCVKQHKMIHHHSRRRRHSHFFGDRKAKRCDPLWVFCVYLFAENPFLRCCVLCLCATNKQHLCYLRFCTTTVTPRHHLTESEKKQKYSTISSHSLPHRYLSFWNWEYCIGCMRLQARHCIGWVEFSITVFCIWFYYFAPDKKLIWPSEKFELAFSQIYVTQSINPFNITNRRQSERAPTCDSMKQYIIESQVRIICWCKAKRKLLFAQSI